MKTIPRIRIMEAYKKTLQDELDRLKDTVECAKQRMIDAPGAMQSHHDTSKVETGWLIDGLGKRSMEITAALAAINRLSIVDANCSKVKSGSIVVLKDGEREFCYFITPNGGGRQVELDDRKILFLSPSTPLGNQLLGKEIGDDVTINGKECKIIEIG